MEVYLDNAATTKLDTRVLKAMLPYMEKNFGNPSSLHGYGRIAKVAIEQSRKTIANLFNAAPAEIFFTSGGTESNNLLLRGAVENMKIRHLISSPIEHHSVLAPLLYWSKQKKIPLYWVKLDKSGQIDYDDLESLLQRCQPALVSLMHANNEIGNLNDLHRIGSLCRQYSALFHTDAIQTIGYYDFDLASLPMDMLVGSAHKIHGPKGIGLVYLSRNVAIEAQLLGGAQERGLRAGTENVAAIVGLAKSLTIAQQNKETIRYTIETLKTHMIEQLHARLPMVEFNGACGDLKASVSTILNVNFPGLDDSEMMLFNLDLRKIAVSAGSACASGSQQLSHVIHTLYPAQQGVSLRFSFSKYNTIPEIDYVVEQLKAIYDNY